MKSIRRGAARYKFKVRVKLLKILLFEGRIFNWVVLWNIYNIYTPFFHVYKEIVSIAIDNSVPSFKKCIFKILDSQRKHWSSGNALSDYVQSCSVWSKSGMLAT